MPTYQYACTECGNRFEVVQLFTDASLTECAECSGKLRKVYGSVGVVFKGSGFYRTDSRAGGSESAPESGDKAAAKTGDKSDSKSEGKKESKTESKTDAKTESKPAASAGSSGSSPAGSAPSSSSSAPAKAAAG